MVTIKNTQTNEITEIAVLDPRSGIDWSSDLVGNANDENLEFSDDDDCDFLADSDTIKWWVDYCDAYEKADTALYDALHETETAESDHPYEYDMIKDAEFNDYPSVMSKAARMILDKQ